MKQTERLLSIMAQLRDKQTGCPWDIEQNFASIAPYTIEEAYEVAEAIAEGDMASLREELGDLLLQVVFYAQMAKEENIFTFEDVAEAICNKLVSRHPHVFGDADITSATAQTENWERLKEQERAAKNSTHNFTSILADIPKALPALTRALKLQKRAAKVGFDWKNVGDVVAKLEEETQELKVEIESGSPREKIQDELGDMLFVLANIARHYDIEPEEALRATNRKFERRFSYIESALAEAGRSCAEASLTEMDALWDEAKQKERQ